MIFLIPISQMYASENQKIEKIINSLKFGIHVCLPCIVQSIDTNKMTVDVQPTVRERVVDEYGEISYVNYPLLINVPIVFPSSNNYHICFPIKLGDECLVVFSDLSIDNWWLKGSVQNPVEQRRHDLSDGFAIFGIRNQKLISSEEYKYNPQNGLEIYNDVNGVGITIGEENGTISAIVTRRNPNPPPTYVRVYETHNFEEIFQTLFPNYFPSDG